VDGKSVVQDEVLRVDNIDYNTKFSIMRAKRGHTGKYKVKAVNSSGSDEAEIEITVLSKPSAPKGPLQVSVDQTLHYEIHSFHARY